MDDWIMINRDDKLVMEGKVTEAFPGLKFNVELDNGHNVLAYLSGRMRKYNIRVLLGDRVKIEISPYDIDRGRIVYRYKKARYHRGSEPARLGNNQTSAG